MTFLQRYFDFLFFPRIEYIFFQGWKALFGRVVIGTAVTIDSQRCQTVDVNLCQFCQTHLYKCWLVPFLGACFEFKLAEIRQLWISQPILIISRPLDTNMYFRHGAP